MDEPVDWVLTSIALGLLLSVWVPLILLMTKREKKLPPVRVRVLPVADTGQRFTAGWGKSKTEFITDIASEGIFGVYAEDCYSTTDKSYVSLQFRGWEIVLCSDGRWYPSDTAGG